MIKFQIAKRSCWHFCVVYSLPRACVYPLPADAVSHLPYPQCCQTLALRRRDLPPWQQACRMVCLWSRTSPLPHRRAVLESQEKDFHKFSPVTIHFHSTHSLSACPRLRYYSHSCVQSDHRALRLLGEMRKNFSCPAAKLPGSRAQHFHLSLWFS